MNSINIGDMTFGLKDVLEVVVFVIGIGVAFGIMKYRVHHLEARIDRIDSKSDDFKTKIYDKLEENVKELNEIRLSIERMKNEFLLSIMGIVKKKRHG